MKKIIALVLIVFVLFLTACDTGSGAAGSISEESSAVTDPVETSGNAEPDETTSGEAASAEESSEEELFTSEKETLNEDPPEYEWRFLPEVYQGDQNGMLLRAEFPDQLAYHEDENIEGSLLLQNETGEEKLFYLHVFVEMGSTVYYPENLPDLTFSEAETYDYTLRTNEYTPNTLELTLKAGESANVSVVFETNEYTFAPDCSFAFRVELRTGADAQNSELLYVYSIPVFFVEYPK